jgi:uncharacterized protein YqeY
VTFKMNMGIMKSMNTKTRLENDLKLAMRAKDETRKRALRQVLSAIKLAEVEKGDQLSEQQVISIIQKEIKSLQESIADANRANRPDLIKEAEAEISILEPFLPTQLSPAELESLAREAISEVGATSPAEMGQVMKVLMPRIQGRAAGGDVSQVVRKLLG